MWGITEEYTEALMEVFRAGRDASGTEMSEYLEKYVYSVATHQEYLEQRIGLERLLSLKQQAKIKQGYSL